MPGEKGIPNVSRSFGLNGKYVNGLYKRLSDVASESSRPLERGVLLDGVGHGESTWTSYSLTPFPAHVPLPVYASMQ